MDNTMYIIAAIISVICAIILAIIFLPTERRKSMKGFGAWLHDVFNFRTLVIEKIFKFLYILSTCFCIFAGLTLIFSAIGSEYDAGMTVLIGFLLVILGPAAVRILYEFIMMFILLVTNVMEINKKMDRIPENKSVPTVPAGYRPPNPAPMAYVPAPPYCPQPTAQAPQPTAQAPQPAPQASQPAPAPRPQAPQTPSEPKYVFCTQCGTKFDANQGGCPTCGKQ